MFLIVSCQRRIAVSRTLLCLFTLLLLALPARAFGQAQNTGTIGGNVLDASKSVIPGASITLTSDDHGNVYRSTSNAQGEFTFNDLPAGTYTMQVNATGFAPFVSRHILVDSDTRLRVDANMRAGGASYEVEVTADSVAVDTQGATVGAVLDNELVENLPIDGNNVIALAALLPGVTDVTAPPTFTDENGGASFSANGSSSGSNLFLFDGLLWNNLYQNSPINYPNHAVLNQVSVQLNNYSAQYGRSAGSIFNVVSKSGSNTMHGELFFHYHNAVTDATNYFSGIRPPQITYQFGGAVGGPILRDKLFYEAEFQGLNGFSAVQASAETLTPQEEGFNPDGTPFMCTNPKLAGQQCASFAGDARAGVDPSQLIVNPISVNSPTPLFGTQYNTAYAQLASTWAAQGGTGTSPCVSTLQNLGSGYLKNAEIPAVCLDPTARAIIKAGYIPTPDTKLGNAQFLYSTAEASRPQREYGGFARIDYNVRPRHTLAFRAYRTDNSDSTSNGGSSQDTGVPTYEIDVNTANITAGSIGHTFIITQNLVNVATLGYKRYEYGTVPTDPTTLNKLGSKFVYPGFQSLPVINVSTRFQLGSSTNAYTHAVNENFEFVDNLSWVRGRHNFQFGVDYLHLQYLNLRANPGSFSFLGNPGFTNAQAADFMMGLIFQMSVGNTKRISALQNAIYGYAQDTWRIKPRLTLNLGVRYELPQPWYQPDGRAATFVRGYQSQKFPGAPANLAFVGDNGVPRSLITADYTNVSPRIGVVYDLFGNGKTAVRLGFGTFYDAIPANIVGTTEPYTYRANYTLSIGSLTNPLAGQLAIPDNYSGTGTPVFTTPYSITYPDANFRNSYTYATNLGIQQQVSRGSVFEINYVGRFGRHLMASADQNPAIVDCSGTYFLANPSLYCTSLHVGSTDPANPPNPTLNYGARQVYPNFSGGGGGVVDLISGANTNYNALQASYRQRAFKNLSLYASYSYSRTLDQSTYVGTFGNSAQLTSSLSHSILSGQNATHVFNMGWRLALGKVRRGGAVTRYVFNGWAFNGIYNARTGHPINLTFQGDELGNNEPNQRVRLLPGATPTLPSNRHRVDKITAWFNPNAFAKADPFVADGVSPNFLVGPAYINTQFSLTKDMAFDRIRKGVHAQLRFEAFNVFNTVNLGQPRTAFSASQAQASTFASINSTGANPNRRIQFGFNVYF